MYYNVARIFVVVLLCAPFMSHAATLYMNPQETEIHPGDTISIAVRIDTEDDECINVVDGVIEYPGNIIPVDISRGDSILPIWVEEPAINKEKQQITFAGGIPNGYCGRIAGDPRLTNVILELIFQAPGTMVGIGEREDIAEITFSPATKVFLNDGVGTEANLRTFGSSIYVHDKPRSDIVDEWNSRVVADDIPPNEFSISLERDESIFNDKYFIVFNTTDKQSGLDHYEVMEDPIGRLDVFNFGGADAPWIVAKSPYRLSDQSLNSTIRVKAVDKAGNEYIATYIPEDSERKMTSAARAWMYVGLFGVLLVLMLTGAYFVYRKNGHSPLEQHNAKEDNAPPHDA